MHIKNAFYSPKYYRNLLSVKDIRLNGYHIKTNNEGDIEYLSITRIESNKKCALEKLSAFPYGLYCTYINAIETHAIVSQKLTNIIEFLIWRDRLGHPRYIMMRKIVENSCGHPLKSQKGKKIFFGPMSSHLLYVHKGKLILKPLPKKLKMSQSHFQNKYRVIFVVQYIYHVDHLDISWF